MSSVYLVFYHFIINNKTSLGIGLLLFDGNKHTPKIRFLVPLLILLKTKHTPVPKSDGVVKEAVGRKGLASL